jgi:type IV pilus assembly protein PilB
MKKRLGNVISDLGFASERDILKALATRLQVEYVDAPLFQVELDVVKIVPEALAKRYNIVPMNLRNWCNNHCDK